ncbi:MAG: hypothetical protein HKN06_03590 [Gammaproteobacteria bacterium]|nr:hypothetical protein [Gammaproteobacteria bacterium]
MNSSGQNFLASAINLVFRDAKIIFGVTALTVIIAVVGSLLMAKTYEAKVTLLVKFGREFVYRAETGDGRETVPQRTGMEEAINAEVQILASRDLKERVIATIGINRLYPDLAGSDDALEDAIDNFASALDINSIERSSIINVYFRHIDPDLAADTLNELVNEYRSKRLDVYRNSDVGFFQGEVDRLTAALREAESDFVSFKAKNKIFEFDSQANLLVSTRNQLATELANAERAISEMREKQKALGGQLKLQPRTIVLYTDSERGRRLDQARSQIFELRLEEQNLLSSYREDSKAVTSVRARIAQLEAFIAEQGNDVSGQSVRTGPNTLYQTLEAQLLAAQTDLSAAEARRDATALQLDQLDQEIVRVSSLNSRYDELAREVESHRSALDAQLNNLSDSRAFAALDEQNRTNIRVVQPAVPPSSAIGMTRKGRVFLAIPLGLLAGVFVAFIMNVFRPTVGEPLTVERRSGLDVLATMDRSK